MTWKRRNNQNNLGKLPAADNDNSSARDKATKDNSLTVATDLSDELPVLAGEIDLFERYFSELIMGMAANDNEN